MGKQQTVLVVDDNREYCYSLCELFAKHDGFQVLKPVHNGAEAIDAITRTQVDIMILDLVMPEVDGFGVLEKIREQNINITVIINSAVYVDAMTSRAMDLGAAYYFIKPIKLELIVHRVMQMVFPEGQPKPKGAEKRAGEWSTFAASSGNDAMDREKLVTAFIREVGIPPHLRGYTYIRQAILFVLEETELIRGITTRLYPKIAEANATTPTRVERAIRHAIEVAWNRGSIDSHHKLFGYTVQERKGKPTNGEFIAMIADRVSMQLPSA